MKRYWVIAYDVYCPAGGLSDIADTFNDRDAAVNCAKTLNSDVVEVLDSHQFSGLTESDWLVYSNYEKYGERGDEYETHE